MAVALLALFLNLAGVGYAATGGNFILGKANSASSTTALTSSASGAGLSVTSTAAGKPAAAFKVTSGSPPFTVNSATAVSNLNADLLDGISSSGFVPAGNIARVDGFDMAVGTFPTWDVGPWVSVGAHCYKSGTNVVLDTVVFNHGPGALSGTALGFPGGHDFEVASGGSSVVATMSAPITGGGNEHVGVMVLRDSSESVSLPLYVGVLPNACQSWGVMTRATS